MPTLGPNNKIGIVVAGSQVDNGRNHVEQYPAFAFPITSVDILGTCCFKVPHGCRSSDSQIDWR